MGAEVGAEAEGQGAEMEHCWDGWKGGMRNPNRYAKLRTSSKGRGARIRARAQ